MVAYGMTLAEVGDLELPQYRYLSLRAQEAIKMKKAM